MTTLKESPLNSPSTSNSERDQDRAEDLIDNWRKYGYVMFPQQRAIYRQIAERVREWSVLEAGCGAGIGTAILSCGGAKQCVVATDKLPDNIEFARALYPWISFGIWDISQPWDLPKAESVVAVEVLEHVADPQMALWNLVGAARKEVWLSTPNGAGKPRPPDNPYHVCEYTPAEMLAMLFAVERVDAVKVLSWEDFSIQDHDTKVDPLVYHVRLR